jgi:hypothetical protein
MHLCGFNPNGLPELWHINNHGMKGYVYQDFAPEYHSSEDFLHRDVVNHGFDGTSPVIKEAFTQYYVNGDVRAFHSAWKRLDQFVGEMFSYGDFHQPTRDQDYLEVAKWKMRVIAGFYQKFAKKPIIGGNIHGFIVQQKA